MMPDIDGYEVAQELRKDPEIGDIPIIMFTAKGQVDDKVAGYEAGADDYLTKPVHPIELVAHVRSLLTRTKVKSTPTARPAAAARKKFIVGVVGTKGGVGVSTLVLNLAASYARLSKTDAVAVELRPGQGTWAGDLGITPAGGLEELLTLNTSDITPQAIESRLTGTSFNNRLLLASNQFMKIDCAVLSERLAAIINNLDQLSPVVFLDIGTLFFPGVENLISLCQEILVVTDAMPTTVRRTRIVIDEINEMTAKVSKNIDLVLNNHIRSDLQLNAEQISKMIPAYEVKVMIPTAPEQIYQAVQKQTPLTRIQPEILYSQQINELAKLIHHRVG
jgi:pilus assembly protein CpaE